MANQKDQTQAAIVAAALRLLKNKGAAATTIEAVAREAGCAKGLVHYHFKTKPALLAAVARQLGTQRRQDWNRALRNSEPKAAIDQSWALLLREARDGTLRAWISLPSSGLTGQAVREELTGFAAMLGEVLGAFFELLGLEPTVPLGELGSLLAAVVHGVGLELGSGTDPQRLQGAYAAAWVGILATSRAATS